MSVPIISIVAATYRRPKLLVDLLKSIEQQSLDKEKFEVVIVDDESGDDTLEVLRKAECENGFNLRWTSQPNAGPATARNTGVKMAKAPLIAFTDDDCVVSEQWLETFIDFMNSNTNCVGAGGSISGRSGSILSRFYDKVGGMKHGRDESGVTSLITANACYRREAFMEVGGFDERFPWAAGEDIELSQKLIKKGYKLGECLDAKIKHSHRDSISGVYRTYYLEGLGTKLTESLGLRPPASVIRVALGGLRNNLGRSLRNGGNVVEKTVFSMVSVLKVYSLIAGRLSFDPSKTGAFTKD